MGWFGLLPLAPGQVSSMPVLSPPPAAVRVKGPAAPSAGTVLRQPGVGSLTLVGRFLGQAFNGPARGLLILTGPAPMRVVSGPGGAVIIAVPSGRLGREALIISVPLGRV